MKNKTINRFLFAAVAAGFAFLLSACGDLMANAVSQSPHEFTDDQLLVMGFCPSSSYQISAKKARSIVYRELLSRRAIKRSPSNAECDDIPAYLSDFLLLDMAFGCGLKPRFEHHNEYLPNEGDLQKEILRRKLMDGHEIQKVECRKLSFGMTAFEATAAMGRPKSINHSVSTGGTREQWVYSSNVYLYFDDGKLQSWQY